MQGATRGTTGGAGRGAGGEAGAGEGGGRDAFRWPVRVYYEDTDSGGVVYYANYLRFLERARTEWLRALGLEQRALAAEQGVLFAVRRVAVDFLRPARLDDRLEVTAELTRRGRASLELAQEVLRPPEEAPLCRAQVQVACLDAGSLRPRPLPAALLERLA
ncbi:MAG: tol-pal system-associated acyl-CoA thioesterase [Gammaproteobacteria bacterium]|nr:MAG: tol-pal system-associated acyl-CoA thioesterase [Gammaproteobacteria bacterium]